MIDLNSPLMLIFGIMATVVLGAAGGYIMGMAVGRTQVGTPLPTTIRLTRERLSAVTAHLDQASAKLNSSQRSDLAGSALTLGRRLSELSNDLGKIERKAKRSEEASA